MSRGTFATAAAVLVAMCVASVAAETGTLATLSIPMCVGCEDVVVNADGEMEAAVAGGDMNRSSIAAHIRFFEDYGYLLLPSFYSAEEMEAMMPLVEAVETAKEEVGGQMMYFEQGLRGEGRILCRTEDFAHRHAGLQELFMSNSSRMVQFTTQLIGEDVILFKEKINFKFPGADGFKAHQDHQAGWGKYVSWFVSIGVCLDEATVHNGCLEVAGGLHKDGLLGEEWKPIEDLELPYEPVPCSPGDVIVFDSYVPHRSFPNLSDSRRRMLFLTYNKAIEGDHREQYFADKRISYPPDIERDPESEYHYRV